MKKVIVSLFLFYVSLIIFIFDFTFELKANYLLYQNKKELTIIFHNVELPEDFLDVLRDVSVREKINISQYNHLDENRIHIYSSNLNEDKELNLLEGKLPESHSESFIANNRQRKTDNNQVGVFTFPPSNINVRYYDMEQIRNVGISGAFYISTNRKDVEDELKKSLSPFGYVTIEDIHLNNLAFINFTYLLLTLFCLVIFFIVLVYYLIENKKEIHLYKLWGYSTFSSFRNLLSTFYNSYIIILIVTMISLILFLFFYGQFFYWFHYSILLLSIILIVFLMKIAIMTFTTRLIYHSGLDSANIKGALPFANYQLASVLLKVIVVVIFLCIMSVSNQQFQSLQKKLNDEVYWDKTRDVYRINVKLPMNMSLASERQINDRFSNLYEQLIINHNVFLMHTENYQRVPTERNNTKYLYELNTSGEDTLLSPYGKSIIINENYLSVNPINSNSDLTIDEQLIYDPFVLNILVPEKYQPFEKKVKSNYLDEFYFQKVTVDNIYNNEINGILNKTSLANLSINVIYVKNNQHYFTYQSSIGENQNYITDPIAIVFQNQYDTSAIGAFATTSLFFIDESKGNAYNNITKVLEETDTKKYVPYVASVYQERSSEIVRLKNQLTQQIMAITLSLILSCLFLAVLTWSYYKQNAYSIYLKFLFGYSVLARNHFVFTVTLGANIVAGVIVFLLLPSNVIIFTTMLITLVECIVLFFFCSILNKQHAGKLLKGENL